PPRPTPQWRKKCRRVRARRRWSNAVESLVMAVVSRAHRGRLAPRAGGAVLPGERKTVSRSETATILLASDELIEVQQHPRHHHPGLPGVGLALLAQVLQQPRLLRRARRPAEAQLERMGHPTHVVPRPFP